MPPNIFIPAFPWTFSPPRCHFKSLVTRHHQGATLESFSSTATSNINGWCNEYNLMVLCDMYPVHCEYTFWLYCALDHPILTTCDESSSLTASVSITRPVGGSGCWRGEGGQHDRDSLPVCADRREGKKWWPNKKVGNSASTRKDPLAVSLYGRIMRGKTFRPVP